MITRDSLDLWWRGAPERELPVAVVIVKVHERSLANGESRRAVAQPVRIHDLFHRIL